LPEFQEVITEKVVQPFEHGDITAGIQISTDALLNDGTSSE
jgi:hypothetical protein